MTAVFQKRVALRWIVTVMFALAFTLTAAATTAPQTKAAGFCECTTYTQQHFGLSYQSPWNPPNAADWGTTPDPNVGGTSSSYLAHNGWHAVNTPAVGDILIVEKP